MNELKNGKIDKFVYCDEWEDIIRHPEKYEGKRMTVATCSVCHEDLIIKDERGFENYRDCSCVKQERHRRRMARFKELSIVDRHACSDVFSRAITEGQERELYKEMYLFATNFNYALEEKDDYVGYLFAGDVGNGKTFLANCICNELKQQGYTVLSFSLGNYLRKIQDGYSDGGKVESNLLSIVKEADMVFIDDLGSEKVSEEWGKAALFALIDERYRAHKPMIITTNLTKAQLEEQFLFRGTRKIVDRILEMCELKPFTWESKRVSKRKKQMSFVDKIKQKKQEQEVQQ